MKIRQTALSYLHPNIVLGDLHANLKLFTETEISAIKAGLPSKGKYRQITSANGKSIRLKYAILVQNGRYFAVYKGRKTESLEAELAHKWRSILGIGKYGIVKLAQDLDTGEWVALKAQDAHIPDEPAFKVRSELITLFKAGQTINSADDGKPVALVRHSESKKNERHYMPVALARGDDLFDLAVDDEARLPCVKWINITLSMLDAARRLHRLGILHRDYKLENMRCERWSGKIRIVDFGLAVEMDANGEMVSDSCSGTPGYVAPEILFNDLIEYGEQTEVYALGATIGKMLGFIEDDELTGNVLFLSEYMANYAKSIIGIPDPLICEEIDKFLKLMCREIFGNKQGTERRPTIDEAIEFFTGIKNKLSLKDKTIKVGLLPVEEYLHVMTDGAESEKQILTSYLKTVDEIWLLDRKKKDALYYEKVRRLLAQDNVCVGYQLFHGAPIKELMVGIPAHVARHGQTECYSYSTIKLGRGVELPAPDQQKAIKRMHLDSQATAVSDQRITLVPEKDSSEFVIKLDLEIIRLKRKYKNTNPVATQRISAMEATIANIKADGGATTYDDLRRELLWLESGAQSTNTLARKLGMFGNVTGRGKLREIREWVEARKPGM